VLVEPVRLCHDAAMSDDLPINDAVMLHFDWEEVDGETIQSVMGQPGYYEGGAGVFWWRLAIVLSNGAIMISVNGDTDEILVTRWHGSLPIGEAPLDLPWIEVASLSELMGRELGWSWIGRNSQGYLDAFTIGSGGIVPSEAIDPSYMFVGIGSNVQIRKITLVSG